MTASVPDRSFREYSWSGEAERHIDEPFVTRCGSVVVGLYGGSSQAGQTKNEDGAVVWASDQWEFAMLLDGHASSESVAALQDIILRARPEILAALDSGDLWRVNQVLVSALQNPEAKRRLSSVRGESAVLICARSGNYLSWFAVGDNLVFLLHDELSAMGQYALNQRQFYEWVGEVNTFAGSIPALTQGVRELRQGENRILMITDGLLEYSGSPFTDGSFVASHFSECNEMTVETALRLVHEARGYDSATIIGWSYLNHEPAARPTE
jgi:hypothetical protein